MKSSIAIYWLLAIFFLIMGTVYTVWNILVDGSVEWAGTIAIYLSGILMSFVAFYIVKVHKAQGGELPEDRLDADIDDGDPEVGEFSPWSWWPMILAFSLGLFLLGFAIGNSFWVSFFAVPIILVAVIGWVYEYYRGHFAR
ncbi:cytochrome c oxidase subunit 4 [Lysinibacter sp. HNR]|uniref:cytochrome c oxidase subunit 4 n=1 Tax=Lysinibacter sp. HNR TaxID=3031408 RepID=UPI0024351D5D|nr:cytochrome c oxidase subunit 4 [Lysinibacter sp. HNR]WGD36234.1 cytochrome c oxidase subunit 4 [Lysinibacter sp. HNR]